MKILGYGCEPHTLNPPLLLPSQPHTNTCTYILDIFFWNIFLTSVIPYLIDLCFGHVEFVTQKLPYFGPPSSLRNFSENK